LLYADETILWRFALPRAGWWRTAQRARLPIRPLSQSQIKREEALKRQAWVQYRSWSRVTSGVLLSVIGAVQYGTSKVFYKVVPHFDAQEFRQYIHQVMATFRKAEKEVVMVVDRSGIHRAHKLAPTLDHSQGTLRSTSSRPIVGTTSTPLKAFGA
jgi:DDE superfamily endonuclease